jgi:hypothetical protein
MFTNSEQDVDFNLDFRFNVLFFIPIACSGFISAVQNTIAYFQIHRMHLPQPSPFAERKQKERTSRSDRNSIFLAELDTSHLQAVTERDILGS